jgi:hypothetical protein
MWVFSLTEAHESMQVKRPAISAVLGIGRAAYSEQEFVSSAGRKFLNSRSRATTRQNPVKR